MPDYYPVFLQLQYRSCVVVGGGKIAAGKVDGLLEAGARVTVISPTLTVSLQAHLAARRITWVRRHFRPGDLQGAFLVICATNRPGVNARVWDEACANNQLVNVVDDTPRCNFIAASILRQGDLAIAISTAGKAPALAVRLKERLQGELGPHYASFLDLAGKLRGPLAQHVPDFEARKELWYRLVDSDVLGLLERGDEAAAVLRISELVGFPFLPEKDPAACALAPAGVL